MNLDKTELAAIEAQADIHHQYLLGLQLMVATRHPPEITGDWMFRLFRLQHEEKFLSSFPKLGLDDLPHAVACAKYHVLSNGIGGVPVEYMEESPQKAWVRFRYPRWMFDGPVICGVPIETSRGFLRGWYAQNGVTLGNPRLGFVCVSEDMTAQFGLCGYFKEYDHDLSDDERLTFAPDERPPAFDPAQQPTPPGADWPPERLSKARRNYACDYICNGLITLGEVLGRRQMRELASEAARLTGLQRYRHLAGLVGGQDGGVPEAGIFLATMLHGIGDKVDLTCDDSSSACIQQHGLRILRGVTPERRDDILTCWIELWRGMIHSHRTFMDMHVEALDNGLEWRISCAT